MKRRGPEDLDGQLKASPARAVEAVRAVRDEIKKLIEGRTAEMSPELVSRVQHRTPAAQT
ncbi:hypothetical protein [Streptomyces zhihengii]|uniref:hypothetical protein n=1 Tax=Streptomyces zhihengii TaxID=1818004 RepID=UPI0033A81D32